MIERLRVEPGAKAHLARRDPRDTLGVPDKQAGRERIDAIRAQLSELQARLAAEATRSVLLILQGLDGSGKDGVIRSVFTGLNPQGVRVTSFQTPTVTELAHDPLWRVHAALPARGEIGIFNRSHYEDVVAVRMLELAPRAVWERRPSHIREWERMLGDEGTTVLKVFLHVSNEEQRKRFEERLQNPLKRWKFRADDLVVAERYDDYLVAWEEAIDQTSTEWAPWHVVPADRNWVKALAVAELLLATLERTDPQFPQPEVEVEDLATEPRSG